MSADSIVSIAWDVLKSYIVVPIKRRFEYVISSKSFANRLREEVKNLKNEADRVQILEKAATNNVRNFHSTFTDWKASCEKDSKEAQDLLDASDEASKTCCYGTLPDPKCRYQFSMKAEAEIKVIRELAEKCNGFKELKDICFIDPSPGDVTAMTSASSASTSIKLGDYDIFESRVQIIREIKDALADNSNSVVGVYGMGGLGKSTLLEEVKRMISEDKSFDWVAKANVSENPDIWTIQGEIADALGLTDIKTKETTTGRAELLQQRLKEESKNRKVLIILDNLWKELDLKSVGIPCRIGNEVMGCKLLLTSRDRKILKSGMGCNKDFLLGELKEDEAKRLFEKLVGDKVHDNKFKPLVDEALHKCAGLPFLIVSMAKYFKGVDLPEWEIALKQIKFSKNEQLGEVINNMLQLSYDHLKDTEKSLLALCVAYGTSKPSFENLVRYGVGWGLFREYDTIEEARGSLGLGIRTLQASSLLLEDGDAYGFKIHDLVHEFVASVALRDHPLLVLKDKNNSIIELSNDKLKSCRALCFPYVYRIELPEELDCPELQIFLLFTYSRSLKVSDSLFYSMKKLMVLNLTGIHLTCFPSSFQFLESLHTLCLDCCSLDNVAILGELKGLQILSFANSNIHRLPREIGQLAELRLLDLNQCYNLKIIEPGVLRSLFKLEELYMKNSFDQWNVVEQTPPTNASLIELNHMKKLHTLHLSIRSPSILPEDLNVEKLTKYEIRIGNISYWQHKCKGSGTLELRLDPLSDVLPKGFIQSISGTANCLLLDKFNGCEQSICSLSQKGFPKLKHLKVTNSSSIQYVLRSPSHTYYETLELLLLENLITLEKICTNNISSKSFNTLKVVRVKSCNKMEVLFPLSILKGLPWLEEIEVVNCKLMRGIVEVDVCSKVKLHNLHVLKLRDLPDIKNFLDTKSAPSSSTSNDQVSTQIAFFNGQQVAFQRLETLEINGLDNIGFIFFPSMVESLTQLKNLTISDCEKMEAIVMEEEGLGMETSETLTFPMLTNLCLERLTSLTCFSCGKGARESQNQDRVRSRATTLFNQEVAFQRLEKLEINGLANLRFIFFPSTVKSLTQLKELTTSNCEKTEAIIMEEEGLGMETSEILAFPMLTDLRFKRLKSCRCFSRGKYARESRSQDRVKSCAIALFNHEVVFPNLENLYIEGMENIEMIWNGQILVNSFSKLKLLSVNECKKLVNVVPSFILGRLLSLETLTAKACDSLEVVFKLQPLNPLDGNNVAQSSLKKLKLDDLSMLNRVWDKEFYRHIKFHCLRSVTLQRCARLTSLFSNSIARDLIQLEELEINQCGIVELIEKEGLSELSINVEPIEGPSHELKVASSLPSYFQHMKTLDVSHCHGLSNVFTPTMATNLVELTNLRISKCEILTEVISDEGGKEGHVMAFNQLKYMKLDGLTRLRCFSSGTYTLMFPLLEDMIVNRCPKMKFFFEGPMEAPKLERVQVGLNNGYGATKCPYFWKGNLNRTIQNMFEEMATFAGTKFMWLSEFPELIGKWHGELNPVTSSWQLETLVVDKCPSFVNAIPSSLMLVLERMTSLQVCNCKPLEEIFDLEGLEAVDCTQVLPQLNYLHLVNLPKLRQLWNRDLQGTMCFNSLQHLSLYKCSNLRDAFVPSMAQCLPNLQEMEIKECDQMEGVIADEDGQGSVVEEITFPNLRWIYLECLPNLTSFLLWKNHTLECPILSTLSIAHCPKMRSLTRQSSMEIDNGTPSLFTPQVQFPKLRSMDLSHMDNLSKIWTDTPQETLTFDCLRKVEVRNCKGLENLFPYWVATSLTHLEKLQVESCEIEKIVANGGDTPHSNTTQDLFPELTSLVLHDMPRLKSFYPNLPTLHWPLLEELRVIHCNKLNMLSFTASMNSWAQKYDQQDLSNQEAHSSFERDFPNFERLLLVNNNIHMIQDGNFPDDIFSKPIALTLACFHDEKTIFPSIFLLERFQNLQSLEVFCSSFEDIFPNEGLVEEGKHLELENLREIKLNKLHNLKRVWREDSLVSKILQSIKTFEIWDCPYLTTIFPTVASFQNLTKLVVMNSSGLVHLVTVSTVTNLMHLNDMTIIGCERMKEIVANDENGEGKMISFGNLHYLTLQDLPSLECFSSISSCTFRFPCLWILKVEECPKMKIFSKGMLSTPQLCLLGSMSLFRYKWQPGNWEKGDDLNTTIQKLSA